MKVPILAALAALVVLFLVTGKAEAGGVVISVGNGGGWCPPVRPICRPVSFCPPVVYRSAWSSCQPAWYSWGPSVVVSSGGSGFSNFSPVVNAGPSVYRVPAPVLIAQPLTVYPATTFGWRR